jgi:hypothetical protein
MKQKNKKKQKPITMFSMFDITKKKEEEVSELIEKIFVYFPIENDRPVGLWIGNVVGSTIVHSYQT